jgi:hypothetical protein
MSLAPLLAVAAFVVMAVAAQAGPPEIGRCVKVAKGTGEFKDAGCEKGFFKGGNYNWIPGPGPKHKFTSTEGLSTFEFNGKKITCKSDTDSGEYTGPKTDSETIVFNGCESAGFPCTTAGHPAGQIETTLLESELGFIKLPKTIGLDLKPIGGANFAEFDCGPIKVIIQGSVIAPITPISKMTTTFIAKFKAVKSKQNPEHFEGGVNDTLFCTELVKEGKSDKCGFTSTDTITNEEPIEINETI